MIKFQYKTTFYAQPTYEFNLPAGHTCPFAKDCRICVDRESGKFKRTGERFRCYAASAERFPGVRKSRWGNYEALQRGEAIIIPQKATHIRIHGAGDFYSQEYFNNWLSVCEENKEVKFWAFTKSLPYWVKRIDDIPTNLELTASRGGTEDYLIEEYGLKFATVFSNIKDVPLWMPIDVDDTFAMYNLGAFALLDNNKYSKKLREGASLIRGTQIKRGSDDVI